MNTNNDYTSEFGTISNSLTLINQVNSNEDIRDSYIDSYTTIEQKRRDQEITKLLSTYVESYKEKVKSNKIYKSILFGTCMLILIIFCIAFVCLVTSIDFDDDLNSISALIQVISVCITFLGLIIGLLKLITTYVFQKNDEEYITRIVELIQKNDLENKKENIKIQRNS